MASSGSVVPAEVFGEVVTVDVEPSPEVEPEAEAGTGAGTGDGAGAGAMAGAAGQIGTRRKPAGNKTQRIKQKRAFPTPEAQNSSL